LYYEGTKCLFQGEKNHCALNAMRRLLALASDRCGAGPLVFWCHINIRGT
jgi:hypothetical protein